MQQALAQLVITVVIYIVKAVYNIVTTSVSNVTRFIKSIFGGHIDEPGDPQTQQQGGGQIPKSNSNQESGPTDSKNEERNRNKESSSSTKKQAEKKTTKKDKPKAASSMSSSSAAQAQPNKLLSLFSWLLISVPQGFVGLEKTFGVLSPTLLQPGLHVSIPGIHQILNIPTQIQTLKITNIPCGTSTGVLLFIDQIQVVSQLKVSSIYETVKNYSTHYNDLFIRDKVHHQVNIFCSKHTVAQVSIQYFDQMDERIMESLKEDNKMWAPGIEIISIRITKPQIPEAIKQNYEEMEKAKIQYLVEAERQKVLLQKQETRCKEALIKAQSDLEVHLIDLKKHLQVKQNQLKMEMIQAEIYRQRKITETDNEFLIYEKRVDADKHIFNKQYLTALGIASLSTNINHKLGNSVPNVEL